ncbi:carbohydrate ABC transporter permease [Paenibacillus agricola]|uniref:Carbohydrate ABC transporter permease n=1 Tax=Paenibacillus agricola TaxID=2716264 RepID=A0ABX0J823_9BACL|nr:carbohydrate ABC transporter permease [Paenibacillus agricola]NHN32519.1 carbohydrate ABC transporter permease [Paenibacillus agricola]
MRTKRFGMFDAFNLLVMLGMLFVTLYPLYYMFIVSISSGTAVSRGDVIWTPIDISWQAYRIVFNDPSIMRAYGNTFLYTSLGVVINLCMTSLCAYPLSRKGFWGRSVFSLLIAFTMFFDGGLIPRFMVVNELGMINTMWALLLPTAINVWYMILMRTFFQGIPDSLHESANIDGAGELRIFLRIVLPLSTPVIATMILFYAVGHWNAFFAALIYLNDKDLFPLQIILRNIVIQGDMSSQGLDMGGIMGSLVIAQNIKYAVVFVAIAPILAVYPFVQKYFVQGVMVGSVKG